MDKQSIRFGYILPQLPEDAAQMSHFRADLERALELVNGRFDAIYSIDHLEADTLESFTALSYLAARYPQLRVGHTVVCQSFRNPALVARMGAALQYLSGGRFVLGMGTGWNEPEYRANGYEFPAAGVRVAQLEEALQIIRGLWTGEPFSFEGRHYRTVEAVCRPRPEPVPPILVGAFKPRMLRLAARHADEWNVSSTGIGRYQRLLAEFERACGEVGRDPGTVARSWGGGCIVRRDAGEARRIGGERYDTDPEGDCDLVGTPGQVAGQVQAFIEQGVSSFYVDCGGFPDLTTLELLIDEVMPALGLG